MSWFSREYTKLVPPKAPVISKSKPVSCVNFVDPGKVPELRAEELLMCNDLLMPKAEHERDEKDISNGKCHYNTLVYTCNHSTPHPGHPHITHMCTDLLVNNPLFSDRRCTHMTPSPYITHATTDCPDCTALQVTQSSEFGHGMTDLNHENTALHRRFRGGLTESEIEEANNDVGQDLVTSGIANGGVEKRVKSRMDITRDREARRRAEMGGLVWKKDSLAGWKRNGVTREAVDGAGGYLANAAESTARQAADAKASTPPSSQKAHQMLRGVYEKDAKFRLTQSETSTNNEESGNTSLGLHDRKGLVILPYKQRPKPAEEKPTSSIDVSGAAPTKGQNSHTLPLKHKPRPTEEKANLHLEKPGATNPRPPTSYQRVTEPTHLKAEHRHSTMRCALTSTLPSRSPFLSNSPDMNAKLEKLRTNRELSKPEEKDSNIRHTQSESKDVTCAPSAFMSGMHYDPTTASAHMPMTHHHHPTMPSTLSPTSFEPAIYTSLQDLQNQHLAMNITNPAPPFTPSRHYPPLWWHQLPPPQAQVPYPPVEDLDSFQHAAISKFRQGVKEFSPGSNLGFASGEFGCDQLELPLRFAPPKPKLTSMNVSVKGERDEEWEDVDVQEGGADADAEWEMV